MINFNHIGHDKLQDSYQAGTFRAVAGELNSIAIPVANANGANSFIIRRCDGCVIYEQKGCLNQSFAANMAFVTLVPSGDTISLKVGDDTIFSSTSEDLYDTLEDSGIPYEKTKYGVRVYFDKSLYGQAITTTGATAMESKSCFNKGSFVNLKFCLNEPGCYIIVLTKNGKKVSQSQSISVMAKPKKCGILISYEYGGFTLRHRIDGNLAESSFETTEDYAVLTDGRASISNVHSQMMQRIYINHNSPDYHFWLNSVLKSGVIINGQKAFSRGEYTMGEQHFDDYSGSTTLVYEDKFQKESCDDCQTGSTLSMVM